jgi:hypothetical protein
VTTVITRLQYGKEPKVVVTYVDGKKVEAPIGNADQFISEEKNPANQKNVAVVDVGHPAFEHYPGLRFVDRPGCLRGREKTRLGIQGYGLSPMRP